MNIPQDYGAGLCTPRFVVPVLHTISPNVFSQFIFHEIDSFWWDYCRSAHAIACQWVMATEEHILLQYELDELNKKYGDYVWACARMSCVKKSTLHFFFLPVGLVCPVPQLYVHGKHALAMMYKMASTKKEGNL